MGFFSAPRGAPTPRGSPPSSIRWATRQAGDTPVHVAIKCESYQALSALMDYKVQPLEKT